MQLISFKINITKKSGLLGLCLKNDDLEHFSHWFNAKLYYFWLNTHFRNEDMYVYKLEIKKSFLNMQKWSHVNFL